MKDKLIFIMILFLIIITKIKLFEVIKKERLLNLKVCICTLGKHENKYIAEFVEHYKNYGVDKIYLYDNNDINGEKFEDVISEYVDNNFVEIINWRGVKGTSTYYRIMDSCYQTHHDEYDWLIFYELDEFIYLNNYQNIKFFLSNKIFDKCESIQLNWVHMSDNNYLLYENKSLNERFPEIGKNVVKNKKNIICFVKTIVRGHLKNINITHNHLLNGKLKSCNGFGEKGLNKNRFLSTNPDYEFNFIRHYYTKSAQEFIEKLNRGDLLRGNNKRVIDWAIYKFFYINKITLKKIEYIQKHLGNKYKLEQYLKKLNEKKEKI